jgi:hypothetical protein
LFKNEFTIEITMLNKIAHKRPFTVKPGTIRLIKRIISPLITKLKSPKVKIVRGSVRRVRIGFKNVFTIPIMTAMTIAVESESTLTPGRR